MMMSRRSLLATVAIAPLVGCSIFTPKPLTDFLGEAASAFTAGNVAVTALTVLVQTNVISKATAKSWQRYVDVVDAQFSTLHGDIDAGVSIQQAAIDAALTALNGLQVASKPVVAQIAPAQAQHAYARHQQFMQSHPGFVFAIPAIIAWVVSNLGTIVSAGGAIASLVQQLIGEFQSVPAGTTTVPQADQAFTGWASALANYNATVNA
jgi:hypothetical protein